MLAERRSLPLSMRTTAKIPRRGIRRRRVADGIQLHNLSNRKATVRPLDPLAEPQTRVRVKQQVVRQASSPLHAADTPITASMARNETPPTYSSFQPSLLTPSGTVTGIGLRPNQNQRDCPGNTPDEQQTATSLNQVTNPTGAIRNFGLPSVRITDISPPLRIPCGQWLRRSATDVPFISTLAFDVRSGSLLCTPENSAPAVRPPQQ